MHRPVHFEIHASDVERARTFYTTLFGWKIEQWGDQPYWLIDTGEEGPGIHGGLTVREGPQPDADTPKSAYVVTMDVAEIDRKTADAEDAGAVVVEPKMPIPGMGWVVYLLDTENNTFGLFQSDENAG